MSKNMIIYLLIIFAISIASAAQDRIVLAAENDWYPYSAEREKKAEGRSVDIIKAAYEAAGANISFDVVPFKRGMVLTKAGKYDGVFNAGLNDAVRAEYLIPRNSVALSEQVVVARIGEPFKNLGSFHGKRLSLTMGYTYHSNVTDDNRIKIEYSPGDVNNLKKIAIGRADFTIIDRFVLQSILKDEQLIRTKLAVVGVLFSENIYIVFSINDSGKKARDLFDQGMDTIKANGVLKSIYTRWDDKLK